MTNSAIVRANLLAEEHAVLAVSAGLTYDHDDGNYPSFRDPDGRQVLHRCSDLRWREPGWANHPSWARPQDAPPFAAVP